MSRRTINPRMNKTTLLIALLLYNLAAIAQNDVLLLQKKGKTKQSFFTGKYISLETKQGNYADGIITAIQKDTVYIRHFDIQRTATDYGGMYFDTVFRYSTAINYRDIGALVNPSQKVNNRKRNGTILMVAGAGVMALGAINGLYRGDPPRDWYEPAGYITAGSMIALGYLWSKSAKPRTLIGKKYTFKILPIATR